MKTQRIWKIFKVQTTYNRFLSCQMTCWVLRVYLVLQSLVYQREFIFVSAFVDSDSEMFENKFANGNVCFSREAHVGAIFRNVFRFIITITHIWSSSADSFANPCKFSARIVPSSLTKSLHVSKIWTTSRKRWKMNFKNLQNIFEQCVFFYLSPLSLSIFCIYTDVGYSL